LQDDGSVGSVEELDGVVLGGTTRLAILNFKVDFESLMRLRMKVT